MTVREKNQINIGNQLENMKDDINKAIDNRSLDKIRDVISSKFKEIKENIVENREYYYYDEKRRIKRCNSEEVKSLIIKYKSLSYAFREISTYYEKVDEKFDSGELEFTTNFGFMGQNAPDKKKLTDWSTAAKILKSEFSRYQSVGHFSAKNYTY